MVYYGTRVHFKNKQNSEINENFNSNLFFRGGGGGGVGCSFLFSIQTWFLHFVIYFTRLVRRYIYMYLRTASSCIIHGVLNVWLNQPSLSGYQVLTFKNGGEFSVTDITQKRFCLLELT